jgi:hypothetical protein
MTTRRFALRPGVACVGRSRSSAPGSRLDMPDGVNDTVPVYALDAASVTQNLKSGLSAKNPECKEIAQRNLVSPYSNSVLWVTWSIPHPRHPTNRKQSAIATESEWRRYRRRGEVTAEKRPTEWTWRTSAGERMRAEAGDWAVIDDAGRERSVAADLFESTYEQTGLHRYRRVGIVLATQATCRQIIPTLEGGAVAEEGDWIIQGQAGERWPVPAEHFEKTYEGPLDDDFSGGGNDSTGSGSRET